MRVVIMVSIILLGTLAAMPTNATIDSKEQIANQKLVNANQRIDAAVARAEAQGKPTWVMAIVRAKLFAIQTVNFNFVRDAFRGIREWKQKTEVEK
jgi:hypothetical protein